MKYYIINISVPGNLNAYSIGNPIYFPVNGYNISSNVLNGNIGNFRNEKNLLFLPVIDKTFDRFDNFTSALSGGIDGFLGMLDFNPFLRHSTVLSKYTKVMMGIGVSLDIAMSAYTNFSNDNLTTAQQWGSFGADVGYIGSKAALTYYAGLGVGKLAVTVGMAAGGFAITTLGFGFAGAIVIGLGAAVIIGVAGAIAIIWLSDKIDDLWGDIKKKLIG